MVTILKTKISFILILITFLSTVIANSRVSFSRPGSMMRVPSLAYNYSNPYLFRINASSEVVNFYKEKTHILLWT